MVISRVISRVTITYNPYYGAYNPTLTTPEPPSTAIGSFSGMWCRG